MFFKVLRRSGRRRRREQGLFYAALVTAVVAFYTLLTFRDLDVLRFLKTLESAAVESLLNLIPVLFGVSIFFVYILVHLAYKYQLDSRQREIGLYLVMGMRRSRLFAMLSLEALWNGAIAFLIGLPIAFLLTEAISLLTAVQSGLGLANHRIMLNPRAILITSAAFFLMQIPAIAWFAGKYVLREPSVLLSTDVQVFQRRKPSSVLYLIAGLFLLGVAYYAGVFGMSAMHVFFQAFLVLIFSGITGSFLVFRGIGGLISRHITAKRPTATGLQLFTGRQLQENAVRDHRSLALSSIFLLCAIAFGSFGISSAVFNTVSLDTQKPLMDVTFIAPEKKVKTVYDTALKDDIAFLEPLYLETWIKDGEDLDLSSLNTEDVPGALVGYLSAGQNAGAVKASSVNELRRANGLPELEVSENHWALYSQFLNEEQAATMGAKIKTEDPLLKWKGEAVHLLPEVITSPLTVNNQVTLALAFVVPDDLYAEMVDQTQPFAWNLKLSEASKARETPIAMYTKVYETLSETFSSYEYGTYLSRIGRSLFYQVASTFITLYLAVLFFLLVNTLLSTKFLMEQRRVLYRYVSLSKLGASKAQLEASVRKQTTLYFLPVLIVAYLSSVPAVITLYNNLTRSDNPLGLISEEFVTLAIVFVLMLIFELIYMNIVRRTALRTLREELGKQRRTI